MKIKNEVVNGFVTLLIVVFCFTTTQSFGQVKPKDTPMKDCCMMQNGKMMMMQNGKMMPMTKDITMKNGTKCMVNGKCVMKDGTKKMMKNGDCMDMEGKPCSMEMKSKMQSKAIKKVGNGMYHCPMHKEMTSNKLGKCPKCKMDLEKSK
jgi:hypothetical protein